jgi:hypothetical protein
MSKFLRTSASDRCGHADPEIQELLDDSPAGLVAALLSADEPHTLWQIVEGVRRYARNNDIPAYAALPSAAVLGAVRTLVRHGLAAELP